MKQVTLILCLLLITINCKAQSGLSNLSFENWSNTIIGMAPSGWFGTTLGQQNSGAQQGSKYVRISGTSPSPNLTGFLSLGGFVGNSSNSFVPYTQRPVSLNGFYRCGGLAADDSVGLMSFMKKAGNIITYDYLFFKTNTSTWTSFSMVYTYFDNQFPDSISIWAMSNPLMMGGGPNAVGAYLELDNLSFSIGTSIEEGSIGSGYLVYPNPAVETLHILSKNPDAAYILITDMQGRCIEKKAIESENTSIDLKNFSKGYYLYTISDVQARPLFTGKLLITTSF